LRFAQKSVSLFGVLNIALEENDAAGAKRVEHDPQARRHGSAIKAHNEELANLTAKFKAPFGRHKE
jgi:hypothetical protein